MQTILVVDDSRLQTMALSSIFADDYNVLVAAGGEEALDVVRGTQPPDIILLDVMMPGMDGYDVCRHLKADPYTADIPVIFLTSHSTSDEEALGFELGAVDYIHKPYNSKVVLARVKTQLDLVEAVKSARQYAARLLTTQEALLHQNDRLDMAAEASGMGIWSWDLITDKIEWDARTFAFYGLDPVLNADVSKYDYFCSCVNPKDLPRVEHEIQQALKGEKEFDCQFELNLPDGTVRHLRKKAKVIRDAAGKPIALIGSSFDVTRRVLHSRQLQIFELAISKTNDCVVICEAVNHGEPRIVYANDTFSTFTGYTLAEVMGKNPRFLQAPGINYETLDQLRTAIKTGQPFRGKLLNVKKGGELFWVSMNLTPLVDESGNLSHWVSVQRDITVEIESAKVLETKRERLDLAQQTAGFGVWDWNLVNGDVYWDLNTRLMFGLDPSPDTAEDVIDTWRKIVHTEDLARLEQEIQGAVEGVKLYSTEYRGVLADGRMRHFRSSATVIRDDEGTALRMVGVNFDVTREVIRSERMKLAELVIDNANDMVFICEAEPIDKPGPRIVFVNEKFERVTGFSKEEAIGKTPRILQGPETDRAALDRIRHALKNWQPVREEVLNYKKNGEKFWDEINITPVANAKGWFTHWISIQRDITERKQSEETLRTALQQAQGANQAKSRFLATMSHELRTPMNGIMGTAQLLSMGDTTEDERREYVQTILSSGKALTAILNDILELSAIEADKVKLAEENFEPVHLVRDTMGLFAPMAREKGVLFEADCHGLDGQICRGDPLRLRQMLSNYISNAIKFTEKGSVRVELKALETKLDSVLLGFSVTDTGIGIPLEKQAQLFQSFSQVDDSYARKYEGTGLGLRISRNVTAHFTRT